MIILWHCWLGMNRGFSLYKTVVHKVFCWWVCDCMMYMSVIRWCKFLGKLFQVWVMQFSKKICIFFYFRRLLHAMLMPVCVACWHVQRLRSVPRKTAKVNPDLIDIDLFGGMRHRDILFLTDIGVVGIFPFCDFCMSWLCYSVIFDLCFSAARLIFILYMHTQGRRHAPF